MKTDNPLTNEFILAYPHDAARVLEELPVVDGAALLDSLKTEVSALVLAAMLPERAAQSLMLMSSVTAAKALVTIQASHAARVYRLLAPQSREAISKEIPVKALRRIRHFINYAAVSAGDLMDSNVSVLPVTVSVGEAIRRIERFERPAACEIYLVDEAHRLLGQVELGRLLTLNHNAKLSDVMNRKVQPLATHAMAEALLSHPAWQQRRRLPVVERDNTLAGVLDHSRVQELNMRNQRSYHDTTGGLVSLVGLYWISVIQLLDSLFGMAGVGRGERK